MLERHIGAAPLFYARPEGQPKHIVRRHFNDIRLYAPQKDASPVLILQCPPAFNPPGVVIGLTDAITMI